MYAVVKSGGRQYRVSVGDVLEVNRLVGARGDSVSLPTVLVVDGASVTSAAAELADLPVTGEVIDHPRGPKIRILKYKNKTGYRKHQGHRQELTRLKVTAIGTEQAPAKADKASAKTDKASAKTDKAAVSTDKKSADKKSAVDTEKKSTDKKSAPTEKQD